jgi:hypothetical protein
VLCGSTPSGQVWQVLKLIRFRLSRIWISSYDTYVRQLSAPQSIMLFPQFAIYRHIESESNPEANALKALWLLGFRRFIEVHKILHEYKL